jgi:hypothetical protein
VSPFILVLFSFCSSLSRRIIANFKQRISGFQGETKEFKAALRFLIGPIDFSQTEITEVTEFEEDEDEEGDELEEDLE